MVCHLPSISGWWLGFNPNLKNDGVRQLGWWHKPFIYGKIKLMATKPPTRYNIPQSCVSRCYTIYMAYINGSVLWVIISLTMVLLFSIWSRYELPSSNQRWQIRTSLQLLKGRSSINGGYIHCHVWERRRACSFLDAFQVPWYFTIGPIGYSITKQFPGGHEIPGKNT